MIREGLKWEICIHEAGHGVLAALLGMQYVESRFVPDGGVTCWSGVALRTTRQARVAAVILHGGKVAERLFGVHIVEDLRDRNSDDSQIEQLKKDFGGHDPEGFSRSCRAKAFALLSLNYRALRETAGRLLCGDKVDDGHPPLVSLRPRPELAQ